MKWYRKLFFKIFLIIWLVSAGGTGLAVLLVQSVAEHRQGLELLQARARAQASLMVARFEHGEALLPEHREHDGQRDEPRRHMIPVRIIDLQTGQRLTGDHGRFPPGRRIQFELTSDTGHRYRVIALQPPEGLYFKRLLGFLVSLQAVLVICVSALASLLLSGFVVRPINRLRRHARDLYDHQNLSSRADDRLSRRQDEIGELAREFNEMASYVETTLTAQQRLLQDVSHELRAPLARLQVAAGLAEQRLGEGDSSAERINRECERLNGLIAEILSLSRLDQADPSGPRFMLKELFEELRADALFAHSTRHLEVHLEPEDIALEVNESLLSRALSNGLSNALKYTPEDAVIEMEARRLPDKRVEIRLRDHGDGVSEALLARLTEPFVRGSGGHGDGYGLGLSIARRAVERLGGEIHLRNHPEGGLEMRIVL